MKILIIDADKDFSSRISMSLEKSIDDLEILTAESYEDGFLELNEKDPDIVIFDITMPRFSGMNFLDKINIISNDSIKIIICNYAFQTFRDICKRRGADYFFDKSADIGMITSIISIIVQDQIKNRPERSIQFMN